LALQNSDSKLCKPLPDNVQPGKSVDLTIDSVSGVKTRKYRIHVPKTYGSSKEVPLILSFHGRGKNAKFQEQLSQFSNSSYGFEGIVVYPEGVPVNLTGNEKITTY
jgi:poly(3-hydroxybutyrate) depolymerase